MGEAVRLTVVPNEGEAEMACQMLRAEGIRCAYRVADISGELGGQFGGWREILVDEADLTSARGLLPDR